jgi:hypothetical protein
MILQSIFALVAISPLLWLVFRRFCPQHGHDPTEDFLWIDVPENAVGRSPAWMRRVGLSPDGTIYLPAAFAGDELEMTVRAIREGEFPVTHLLHTFVPSGWLARVAQDKAELCASVEKAVIHFYTGYRGA